MEGRGVVAAGVGVAGGCVAGAPGTSVSTVEFVKMHGAGNDFVVIDCIGQRVAMTPELARAIADRHCGIGCDQVLLVDPPPDAGVDFGYRIFNADGGEVEQCGNGARCFVRFVHERGLTGKRTIRVATRAGVIEPRLRDDGSVSVAMGEPEFEPERVPFDRHALAPQAFGRAGEAWALEVDGRRVPLAVLSMGNPHAVQLVPDVDRAAVGREGPLIERHARFPSRVNAGFMQVVDPHHIRLRVYERGAGETLSCGTGACAAAVAGIRGGLLETPVEVETRGGKLTIEWPREHNSVVMTGPAVTVFAGRIDLACLLTSTT